MSSAEDYPHGVTPLPFYCCDSDKPPQPPALAPAAAARFKGTDAAAAANVRENDSQSQTFTETELGFLYVELSTEHYCYILVFSRNLGEYFHLLGRVKLEGGGLERQL